MPLQNTAENSHEATEGVLRISAKVKTDSFVFVYTYGEGRASLEVRGFEPNNAAIQTLETSVAETRGVQLAVNANAMATGEDGGLFVE